MSVIFYVSYQVNSSVAYTDGNTYCYILLHFLCLFYLIFSGGSTSMGLHVSGMHFITPPSSNYHTTLVKLPSHSLQSTTPPSTPPSSKYHTTPISSKYHTTIVKVPHHTNLFKLSQYTFHFMHEYKN